MGDWVESAEEQERRVMEKRKEDQIQKNGVYTVVLMNKIKEDAKWR